jgi:pimeloyl-ACP methyl ester carboxylesterase
MLALAYAAEHPEKVCAIVLVGCGTFDKAARGRLRATLDARIGTELRSRLEQLKREFPDPDERLKKRYELTRALYDFDPVDSDDIESGEVNPDEVDQEAPPFDMRAHTETWNDMLRLQEGGVYPAAFAAIESPVLMLHGTYDPHPGRMIRSGLKPYLPQLEYREWERCGHRPWVERGIRDEFFGFMRDWLRRRFAERERPS